MPHADVEMMMMCLCRGTVYQHKRCAINFWVAFLDGIYINCNKKKNNRLEAIGGDSYLQIYIHTKNIMFAAQFDINSM